MERKEHKLILILQILTIIFLITYPSIWNNIQKKHYDNMTESIEENIDETYKIEPYTTYIVEETESEELETVTMPVSSTTRIIEDYVYFAQCVMSEAGDQDELGKRLVIDVILNRLDNTNFPNTINDIINEPYQFEVVSNGSINEVIPTEDIYTLIQEEIQNRTNYDVLYFRTDHYHNFGTQLFQHQDHYFSKD